MSEDVRKNLRTQGRYSDKGLHFDDKSHNRDKRQKVCPPSKGSPEKKVHKRNSDGSKGISVPFLDESISPPKYEENADYTFSQLDDIKKPIEITGRGEQVLSKTENGESKILFEPQFFDQTEAWDYFDRIYSATNWHSKNILIQGVEYPQPRLVAWYGPFPYTYSGATLEAAEMPDTVLEIKEQIEKYLASKNMNVTFNSVLLNLYRDGKDSVAWHSDDELTMGISPTIASVSLGETRKFQMRPKVKHFEEESAPEIGNDEYVVRLTHGSLIIMTGCMQDDWQHRVPKEYHDKEARINLTFRTVYPFEKAVSLRLQKRKRYGRGRYSAYNSWTRTPDRKTYFKGSRSCDRIQNCSLLTEIDAPEDRLTKKRSVCDLNVSDSDIFASNTKKIWMANIVAQNAFIPIKDNNIKLENQHFDVDSMRGYTLTKFAFTLKKTILENIHKIKNPEKEELEFLCKLIDTAYIPKNKKLIAKRMQSVFSKTTEVHSLESLTDKQFQYSNSSTASKDGSSECNDSCYERNYNISERNKPSSLDNTANDVCISQMCSVDSNVKGRRDSSPTEVEARNIKKERFVSNLHDANDHQKNASGRKRDFSCSMENLATNITAKESDIEYDGFELEDLIACNVNLMHGASLMNYVFALKNKILKVMCDFKNREQEELEFLCSLKDDMDTEKNQRSITKRIQNIVIKSAENGQINFHKSTIVLKVPKKERKIWGKVECSDFSPQLPKNEPDEVDSLVKGPQVTLTANDQEPPNKKIKIMYP